MDAEIERAINEIAARQGGHLLRRQLLSAGASASWIDRRRSLGLLVQAPTTITSTVQRALDGVELAA